MAGTFSSVTSIPCGCGTLERLSRDKRYPIAFDEMTGEFSLEGVDGRWQHSIYHCPWCGGCTPSKKHTLFTEPSDEEKAEVNALLAGAKSLTEAVRALGTPDHSINCGEMEMPEAYSASGEPGSRQRSVHQYTGRWTTLAVHVIEFDDDSITYAISGKLKGMSPIPEPKRNWWPSWKWR